MEGEDSMEAAATGTRRLTSDEFFAMFPEEDNVRRELIGGQVFLTPAPLVRHQRLVGRLGLSLGRHLEAHPSQGEVFNVPLDIVMTRFDVVEPDVQVILGYQTGIMTEKNVQGAPGLVIEVLSPSTKKRDLTLKRQLYDREGVREYWLVDPVKNTVTVHRRAADGSFPIVSTLDAASGKLETPLLPGWSLELAHFFR
jgi:Uma2 family endonuclease